MGMSCITGFVFSDGALNVKCWGVGGVETTPQVMEVKGEQCSKPRLVELYMGLYYPIIWGL